MSKRKQKTKRQTKNIFHNTLHSKLQIEQHELHGVNLGFFCSTSSIHRETVKRRTNIIWYGIRVGRRYRYINKNQRHQQKYITVKRRIIDWRFILNWMGERLSNVKWAFYFSHIMARTNDIRWDYNDVRFLLDHHAWLDFYRASSLNQQSVCRHFALLEQIIGMCSCSF